MAFVVFNMPDLPPLHIGDVAFTASSTAEDAMERGVPVVWTPDKAVTEERLEVRCPDDQSVVHTLVRGKDGLYKMLR